ncbi:MAG: hypothetical protein JNK58_06095 [Phycisphaerae bacterium]|nr:hypothetical protein [Phycisphaerae bacterium]
MTSERITIHRDPLPGLWRPLAEGFRARSDARARGLRGELGLPGDRPVVMSGHQAFFWHCGILAKVFAADSAARGLGGAAGWAVVDQDEAEFSVIRVPVRDGRNRLGVQELRLCDPPAAGVASGSLPSFEARSLRPTGGPFALPSVSWGAASLTESLLSRRAEPSAARQVGEATFDLLGSYVSRPRLVYATDLSRTEMFRWVVDRMASDPAAAVGAYNESVGRFPEAGLAALGSDAGKNRFELPLWRLESGKARRRVWSDQVRGVEVGLLAPRALLLTGFLRLFACDLFIHGQGGAVYDRVTEAWMERWLGLRLAPTVMVSADVRLPFEEASVSESEVARAVWRAAHARHDPGLAGRDDLVPRKRAMVETIRSLRERGEDARAVYLEMHRMLATYRDQERGRLGDLRDEAEKQVARLASAGIAGDRTWAFPFHRAETLTALRDGLSSA